MHEARRVGGAHGDAARNQREPAALVDHEGTTCHAQTIKAASPLGKATPTLVCMQVRLPNGVNRPLTMPISWVWQTDRRSYCYKYSSCPRTIHAVKA